MLAVALLVCLSASEGDTRGEEDENIDELMRRRHELRTKEQEIGERLRAAQGTPEEAAIQQELTAVRDQMKKWRENDFHRREAARRVDPARDAEKAEFQERLRKISDRERELHNQRRDLLAKMRELMRENPGGESPELTQLRLEDEKLKARVEEVRAERRKIHEDEIAAHDPEFKKRVDGVKKPA